MDCDDVLVDSITHLLFAYRQCSSSRFGISQETIRRHLKTRNFVNVKADKAMDEEHSQHSGIRANTGPERRKRVRATSRNILTEAQQTSYEGLQLKDLRVKNYLFQAIDRSIMETILKKDTTKDIWDAMKRKYEGNIRVKRSTLQGLRRDFETLEMKSGETITTYFSRVMAVANKMRVYGDVMTDVTVVEKILRSLTDKFNYIVCAIEESKDIDAMSIDELQSSLIVHEQKFNRHSNDEQALKSYI
ncbi:unnamed protein product [Fraxinus pennsylvanica]|uniref:Retrovirus-related Pol polyprotein from transposon TNT 1-94 n=1 Tax=Fraxinus pennsylvanica TaxID=56036 RepID=A0AAD2AGE3_9LAMI|nr:unnamed protein product [Fraxinus pennsylvanica]